MKKYFIFIASFLVFYFVLRIVMEWGSGLLLTSSYTPDMDSARHMGGHARGNHHMDFNLIFLNFSFWSVFISATLSYWLSNKLIK